MLVLGGLIAVLSLPLEQYPMEQYPINSSSTISISASYGWASAKTIEQSVTQVIEQSLTGLNHLIYSDSSSSDGQANIQLTFLLGTDPRYHECAGAEQVAVYRGVPSERGSTN